jgi:hypothetical protein
MSTSDLPAVSEEDLKLEEEEENDSAAAQQESETVSLDVDTDSAMQRVERAHRKGELDAERDAVNNHKYCAIVDLFLVLLLLLSVHLSLKPSVTAAPIVTTNWCTAKRCEVNLVETSFNTGYLSLLMLCVFFVEDVFCGFIIPRVYTRLARVRANFIGTVSSWIGLSLLHMQIAILSGSVDPRMFCMYPLLMASFYLIEYMQAPARQLYPRMFCTLLIIVQWVLFITGEMLQAESTLLRWWLPFLAPLECCYLIAMLWCTDANNEWSTKDRHMLLISLLIRSVNIAWLAIALIAAQ